MSENVLCTSIMEHFSTLPDPRILLKTRHRLVDIVTMALCAVIAGADDWVEIAAYAKAKEVWFKGFLKFEGPPLLMTPSAECSPCSIRMHLPNATSIGFMLWSTFPTRW